jgi:hypothetical protein
LRAREPAPDRADADTCPSSNDVAAFVDGGLSPSAESALQAHLACSPQRTSISTQRPGCSSTPPMFSRQNHLQQAAEKICARY